LAMRQNHYPEIIFKKLCRLQNLTYEKYNGFKINCFQKRKTFKQRLPGGIFASSSSSHDREMMTILFFSEAH
jgi:hypothetical protein